MDELTESARQSLVSQGIVIGTLSVLNSLGLLLTGIAVLTRANDILHFTSLTHLAILEIVCGTGSLLVVAYLWWIVAAYRSRQLEIRSKYLDESLTRGLYAIILPLLITFSALIVSAVFMMLKAESSSTYDLKGSMTLYSSDVTRKIIIDRVQMIFECCGSQSLLDWFLIDWQNTDVEPGEHLQNNTFTDWDSVPFSCCCPEAPPPCVHHQLRAFGVGSLYTVGCADKLDEAVFIYIVLSLFMLFTSTFLMLFIIYTSRKLQTSTRSAIQKGDATAPGAWWILSPYNKESTTEASNPSDDTTPLLEDKTESKDLRKDYSVSDYWFKQKRVVMSPILMMEKSKINESIVANDDWETYRSGGKNNGGYSSEDWTRRAYDASGSTSTTSFLTTSAPINSTPESRHSVSDTAVANLEVSHHFEHKVRPLFRS